MRFFWGTYEWSRGWLEDYHKFPNSLLGNYGGTGWPDKFCHLLLHLCLVIILVGVFGLGIVTSILISIVLGILYEWVFDCLIWQWGASKFDIIANLLGDLLALVIWLLFNGRI